MKITKILIFIIIFSNLLSLNAAQKEVKKNILHLFQINEIKNNSNKTNPKLVNLFDNIKDDSMPSLKTQNLQKYYPKVSQKDENKTKNITILEANLWQKNNKKNLDFEELKEIDEIEKNSRKKKEEKPKTNLNYYDEVTKMVKNAFSVIGAGYKFGSRNKDSTYDCSSFTQRTFAKIGIKLPRDTIEQSQIGKKISKDNLMVGDLVFFRTYRKSVSHVGIYIGDNKIIHASTTKGVGVDDLDDSYYKSRYLFSKRVNFTN